MRFLSYYLVAVAAGLGGFILGIRYEALSEDTQAVANLIRLQETRIERLSEENARLKEVVDKLGTVVRLREILHGSRTRLARNDIMELADSIHLAGQRYGIRPEMILAVIQTESSFVADAISNKGAIGLMQLLPSTAREVAGELEIEWTGDHLLKDPQVNIELGAYYLSKLIDDFEDVDMALSAYNAGPGRVSRLVGRGIEMSGEYSHRVLSTMDAIY
jgi:soluble lytic murein transglycosylase